MRNRLGILIGIVVLIFVLVGLNAATYVQREKTPDTEVSPNRSSFNSGATGTQAFYSLLAETGRWLAARLGRTTHSKVGEALAARE